MEVSLALDMTLPSEPFVTRSWSIEYLVRVESEL